MDLIKDNKYIRVLYNEEKSVSSIALYNHIMTYFDFGTYEEFDNFINKALPSKLSEDGERCILAGEMTDYEKDYYLTHKMSRIIVSSLPKLSQQIGLDIEYLFLGDEMVNYVNLLKDKYGKSDPTMLEDTTSDSGYSFTNPKTNDKVNGVTSLYICDVINHIAGYDSKCGLTPTQYNQKIKPQVKAAMHKDIMKSIRLYVKQLFPELTDKVDKEVSVSPRPTSTTDSFMLSLPNSYLDIGTATYQDSLNRNKSMYILTPDLAANFSSKLNNRVAPKLKDLVNKLQKANSPFSRFPRNGVSLEALQTNKPLPEAQQDVYFTIEEANTVMKGEYSHDELNESSGRHHFDIKLKPHGDTKDKAYHIIVWQCAYGFPLNAWYKEPDTSSVFDEMGGSDYGIAHSTPTGHHIFD